MKLINSGRYLALLGAAAFSIFSGCCATVEGVGEDIENLGDAIEDEAEDAHEDARLYLVMDDFRAAGLRYNAAFDAHREMAAEHSRRAIEGDAPSIDELILERLAKEELNAARCALLASLVPISDEH